MKLLELSRAGLFDLYAKQEQAKRDYVTAVNATLAALGLDPRENHQLNLDTGELTPAPTLDAPTDTPKE